MKKLFYGLVLAIILPTMLLSIGAYNLGNITFGQCALREGICLLIGWFALYKLDAWH